MEIPNRPPDFTVTIDTAGMLESMREMLREAIGKVTAEMDQAWFDARKGKGWTMKRIQRDIAKTESMQYYKSALGAIEVGFGFETAQEIAREEAKAAGVPVSW